MAALLKERKKIQLVSYNTPNIQGLFSGCTYLPLRDCGVCISLRACGPLGEYTPKSPLPFFLTKACPRYSEPKLDVLLYLPDGMYTVTFPSGSVAGDSRCVDVPTIQDTVGTTYLI